MNVIDSEAQLHRPSRLRSFMVKLFVLVVLTAVLLLVAIELSIVLKLPWLDPRPALLEAAAHVAAFVRGLVGR